MNSRERVVTALNHEEPDRLPIDLGGSVVTSIAISTYGELRDYLKLLPRGTLAEVRAETQRRIRDLVPGGGFVFNPVHNIQPLVPAENIMAMFETAREWRY